jgi:nicotinamidase-related amidase
MVNEYEEGRFTEEQVLSFARKAYRNGDAGFDIDATRCALLVIDMQDEFVKPHWGPDWVPDATRKAPTIRRLIDKCRSQNIPVIYTVYSKTHNYLDRPKTGSYMPGRFPEVKVDQSHFFTDGNVWHELAPAPGEVVIHKPSYGAFYDTPLETILRNMGRDTVLITGCITTYCCGTTARQAYERGFKVVFGSDLTGIDDPDLMEHELMIMRKGFARVLSCDEIIRLLERHVEGD